MQFRVIAFPAYSTPNNFLLVRRINIEINRQALRVYLHFYAMPADIIAKDFIFNIMCMIDLVKQLYFFYLFSFLLTINLKLLIVHVEIKIVNKEAATE